MLNVNQNQLDGWVLLTHLNNNSTTVWGTVLLNNLRCGRHANVASRLEKFNLIPLTNLKILSGKTMAIKVYESKFLKRMSYSFKHMALVVTKRGS